MRFLKLKICLVALACSASVSATENTRWFAGSSYVGDVIIPIEGMKEDEAVVWHCGGQRCELDGPWGQELSLVSCRNLVKKIGKITYYGNNKGKLWSPVSNGKMLERCNRGYD